jgi:hypothetical protein
VQRHDGGARSRPGLVSLLSVGCREASLRPRRAGYQVRRSQTDRVAEVLLLWFDIHRRLGVAAGSFFGTLNVGRIYKEKRLLIAAEVQDELVSRGAAAG